MTYTVSLLSKALAKCPQDYVVVADSGDIVSTRNLAVCIDHERHEVRIMEESLS